MTAEKAANIIPAKPVNNRKQKKPPGKLMAAVAKHAKEATKDAKGKEARDEHKQMFGDDTDAEKKHWKSLKDDDMRQARQAKIGRPN